MSSRKLCLEHRLFLLSHQKLYLILLDQIYEVLYFKGTHFCFQTVEQTFLTVFDILHV